MSEEQLQHGAEEPHQNSSGQAHPVVREDILKKAEEIARLLRSSEEVNSISVRPKRRYEAPTDSTADLCHEEEAKRRLLPLNHCVIQTMVAKNRTGAGGATGAVGQYSDRDEVPAKPGRD